MLVAPRKPTIYPERVPFPTVVRNEVDVLLEAARARRIDRILYPKDALLKAKTDHPLFGPYDTHWNAHGAYLAYAAVMERLSRSDPSLAPLPLSAFAMDVQGRNSNDLAAMLGIVGWVDQHHSQFVHEYRIKFEYLEERQDLESPAIIETNSKSQKTLLLVRELILGDASSPSRAAFPQDYPRALRQRGFPSRPHRAILPGCCHAGDDRELGTVCDARRGAGFRRSR